MTVYLDVTWQALSRCPVGEVGRAVCPSKYFRAIVSLMMATFSEVDVAWRLKSHDLESVRMWGLRP
jgi:hypothetical protein